MAGLYIREMQRLGLPKRAIIVCPANLTSKWVDNVARLLGGGLKHLTYETVSQGAVNTNELWVISLEPPVVRACDVPQRTSDARRPPTSGDQPDWGQFQAVAILQPCRCRVARPGRVGP